MRACPRCGAVYRAEVLSCSSDGATLVTREDDPLIGSQLGRFILESLLSDGVTGRVYRAQGAAVRVLYGDFGAQELIVRRLMRDVEAARKLQHPSTARILDAGTDDGSVFIASEFAEGAPLGVWIEKEDYDVQSVGAVAAQIAGALTEAHETGVLHRNLSPSNIIVNGTGDDVSVRVLDFGLGSVARASQAIRFRTSRDYAAPEALRPSGASEAADVYAFGLLLKDLLSRASGDKQALESLAAVMTATKPSERPKGGRAVLERLAELGFSAVEVRGTPVSKDLASDLEADGLVVIGQDTETPDRTPKADGLVIARSKTSYVFNKDQRDSSGAVEEIDVEASRKKLGFTDDPAPRKKATAAQKNGESKRATALPAQPVSERPDTALDEKQQTSAHDEAKRNDTLLDDPEPSPIVEKRATRTDTLLDGAKPTTTDTTAGRNDTLLDDAKKSSAAGRTPLSGALSGEPKPRAGAGAPVEQPQAELQKPSAPAADVTKEMRGAVIDDPKPPEAEETKEMRGAVIDGLEPPAAEVTKEMPGLDAPASAAATGQDAGDEPEPLESGDLELIEDSTGGSEDPFFEGSVVRSASDLGKKAVGGVSSLPAESAPPRPRPSFSLEGPQPKGSWPTEGSGPRPKGSWPTADLVLPNRSAEPGGDQRAPTSVIRPRGPSRPGSQERQRQETMIIRARSRPGDAPPSVEALPVDRAPAAQDPAEVGMITGDLVKASNRRRMLPFAIGGAILIVTAAAIALPRLGDDPKPTKVTRPVLIEATPDAPPQDEPPSVETKDEEVAALAREPAQPEEAEEESKATPVPASEEDEPARKKAVEQRLHVPSEDSPAGEAAVLPPGEAPAPPAVEPPPKRPVVAPPPKKPTVDRPRRRKRAVKARKPKKRARRRAARRKRRQRKERERPVKPPPPKKLKKGTLIDPFAE